ncbi:hypothetical protein R1sor_013696 [Riccia sorocarpa]|uniref:Reverse transcriptase domain-containing protein n=1 Tax=Riccia sorocarpa TaxID=122646 RepID=A0ABD3HA97_9MARC
MSTWPLIMALREEERVGHLQGLNIGGDHTLLHQLFADDTCICITAEERQFEKLKEVIKEFENASGARLNLQKSIVMQLRSQQHPDWMGQTGCEIAGLGSSFKYLGVATSSHVDEKAVTQEILMSIGFCKDGLEELERLCRNFLWGWNEEGNPKHALIAWERITQENVNGGLGWMSFRNISDALNVRLVSLILEGGDTEWIHLARSFILRTLRRGSYQRECSQ